MKEKIKKISKYLVNGLNFINMILVGLAEVWGWHIDSISKSIIVVAGAISVYLGSGKLFEEEKLVDYEDAGDEIDE